VTVTINGIAKGSGMIAPDMATMLAFVFTDAAIAAPALQALLSRGTVDHLQCRHGRRRHLDLGYAACLCDRRCRVPRRTEIERATDRRLAGFRLALDRVLADLAEQIARDGEGARKLVEVIVEGAVSKRSARRIALSIANSPLVKTAIGGEDAKLGPHRHGGRQSRRAGRPQPPGDLVRRHPRRPSWGARSGLRRGRGLALMKKPEIRVKVDIGLGRARDRVLTCDLTKEYIAINGDYRS